MKWTVHHGGKYCHVPNAYGTRWHGLFFDPLNDLNAMHEAEKILNASQQLEYAMRLHKAHHSERHYLHNDFFVCHAPAAQRAEAFLKTMNLWKAA